MRRVKDILKYVYGCIQVSVFMAVLVLGTSIFSVYALVRVMLDIEWMLSVFIVTLLSVFGVCVCVCVCVCLLYRVNTVFWDSVHDNDIALLPDIRVIVDFIKSLGDNYGL